MTTALRATLISSPNPSNPFTEHYPIALPAIVKLSDPNSLYARRRGVASRCRSSSEQGKNGSLMEALSGMVDERVQELLSREENRVLLDGLDQAALRVEMAKRELVEIEKQEVEARQMKKYINQLEIRASEVAECQNTISEARAMVEEAERSLNIEGVGDGDDIVEREREAFSKNKERLESVKAGFISAVVGTLAGLPISLSQVTTTSQFILPSAVTFISCALFGVTFRYAIRRDLDNFQLKTGTSAAFGFVKGLAMLEGGPPLDLGKGSLLSHAFEGAVYVSESLLIFLFAAVGLDLCIKLKILSPFPIDSRTETK